MSLVIYLLCLQQIKTNPIPYPNVNKKKSRFRRFKRQLAATTPYRKTKLFLKRLLGKELWINPEIHCDIRQYGDWHLSARGLRNGLVYSLGVGDDISFDLALVREFQVTIHAFDPTPQSIRHISSLELPEKFFFHPWAVTDQDHTLKLYPRLKRRGKKDKEMLTMIADPGVEEKDAIQVPGLSLDSIMQRLGHGKVDLLKMDIEGAEYRVIDGILKARHKPKQLLIEFHHRFPRIGKQKTVASLRALRAVGYKVFAVSDTGYEASLLLSD